MENRAARKRERVSWPEGICYSIFSFPISIFSLKEGL
jgi:hypothetical protein